MQPTHKQQVILDFDGLLTNVAQEAQPVNDRFMHNLQEHLGINGLQMTLRTMIAQRATQPGDSWEYDGKPTARWDADPYIQASTYADHIYQQVAEDTPPAKRSEALTKLFREAQKHHTRTCWREGTTDLLKKLRTDTNTVVVSNSDEQEVKSKLARIGHADLPVYGNAKKYVLSDQPQRREHGPRQIRTDRPHYRQTLDALAQDGFTPQNTVVAGDIYEFDLALPQELGYGIILAWPHGNSEHDRQAVKRYSRGRVVDDPTELARQAKSL